MISGSSTLEAHSPPASGSASNQGGDDRQEEKDTYTFPKDKQAPSFKEDAPNWATLDAQNRWLGYQFGQGTHAHDNGKDNLRGSTDLAGKQASE